MTHQGMPKRAPDDSLEMIAEQKEAEPQENIEFDAAGKVRCDVCGFWCGPFARLQFWQGGRAFLSRRRNHDHFKGNRGRDSPPLSCGKMEAKHNSGAARAAFVDCVQGFEAQRVKEAGSDSQLDV